MSHHRIRARRRIRAKRKAREQREVDLAAKLLRAAPRLRCDTCGDILKQGATSYHSKWENYCSPDCASRSGR